MSFLTRSLEFRPGALSRRFTAAFGCAARVTGAGLAAVAALVFSATGSLAQDDDLEGRIGAIGQLLAQQLDDRHGENPAAVAIWPFAPPVPIDDGEARRYNAVLRTGLQRALDPDRFGVLSALEVARVRERLMGQKAHSHGIANPVAALADEPIDIVIVGSMRHLGDHLSLAYEAIAVTDGRQLAGARDDRLPLVAETGTTRPLSMALRDAAGRFKDHAHEMEVLANCGIGYRDSGAETEFGRWLGRRLVDEISRTFADLITGVRLAVDNTGEICRLETWSGPTFVLRGEYWDFERRVDLRLRLRTAGGEEIAWSGLIRRADLDPGMSLEPPRDNIELARDNRLGPLDFRLSSDRGDSPSYTIGEELHLRLKVDDDAYVHCFHRDDRGRTTKIFPNPHHTDPLIEGGRLHTMPGELFPFIFDIKPPPGIDLIKCFASADDIAADLPKDLVRSDLEPLPDGLATSFPRPFRRAAPTHLSEASLLFAVQAP